MTLAVILPFVSTYSSTGVPSGVLPKSILVALLGLLESASESRPPALAVRGAIPDRLTATKTTRYADAWIDLSD